MREYGGFTMIGGITVSGAQAIYVAEDVLSYYLRDTEYPEFISHYVA